MKKIFTKVFKSEKTGLIYNSVKELKEAESSFDAEQTLAQELIRIHKDKLSLEFQEKELKTKLISLSTRKTIYVDGGSITMIKTPEYNYLDVETLKTSEPELFETLLKQYHRVQPEYTRICVNSRGRN